MYTLVIDKERAEILQMVFNAAGDDRELVPFIMQNYPGHEKVLLDLITENAEKVHELGWCIDPNCKQK